MTSPILIVENDNLLLVSFCYFLSEAGYTVFSARNYDDAISIINSHKIDTIIADIVLEGKTGIDLLRSVRKKQIDCPFVIMTGYPEVATASEAVNLHAFAYLIKPVEKEMLLNIAKSSTDYYRLKKENHQYQSNLDTIFTYIKDGIILFDKDSNVVEVNKACCQLCDLPENIIGKTVSQIDLQCSKHCFSAIRETVETNKPRFLYRLNCCHKDSKEKIVTIITSSINNNDDVVSGAIAIIHDETPEIRFENQCEPTGRFHRLIGTSQSMQELYACIKNFANANLTVLITGETGTGKELVAEAIHYASYRANKPLVKVNCSALNQGLIESELFGHKKGAFTSALTDRIGRFENANGGTIFLDEITELPLEMQAKLLRVLQERIIERVGDSTPIKLDIRIIAACNRNIEEYIKEGKFRDDLYYRLNYCRIRVPPLRDRREDIPLLSKSFLKYFAAESNKVIKSFSTDSMEQLKEYHWPGNVRELENCIAYACCKCNGPIITLDDLPMDISNYKDVKLSNSLDAYMISRSEVEDMIKKCRGNKAEAARRLDISRQTVYRVLGYMDQNM